MTEQELIDNFKVQPQLFAYAPDKMNEVGSNQSGFTFKAGIPPMYAERTGKKLARGDMNGLGRLISQARFFNELGGYYTFDKAVSDKIGGYPEGAILRYRNSETGQVRVVRSMMPDNTFDFVENPEYIDGEHWSYVDQIRPVGFRPRIFPDWKNRGTGTLNLKGTNLFEADRDMLFVIQSGPPNTTGGDTTGDEQPAYFWVSVCKANETEYHTAGLLAYMPPVSSAYLRVAQSAKFYCQAIGQKAGYTAFYSSSPVQLYLHAGDKVKIVSNRDFNYSSGYTYVPLVS